MAVKSINLSLKKIHLVGNTQEHYTSRATDGLLHHYFTLDKFAITPEQIQVVSKKRPDYTVEIIKNDEFKPYLYTEVKSLVNSNFNNIMDQLYDSILFAVDSSVGDFSVYVIAMKGTKIAFFQFYSYISLLEEYGIPNYKGFVPLTQLISMENFVDINDYNKVDSISEMLKYVSKHTSIVTNKDLLIEKGVESTEKIPHPHI